jgi:hypothetical protein
LGFLPKEKRLVANARGRKYTVETVLTFGDPNVFDIPYSASDHHRFVLQEIRSLLRPSLFDLRSEKTAKLWRDAIIRNAPILEGFFKDEPKLRDRMLGWCEKVLERKINARMPRPLR